jgi:transcriptional regulator with XRE-family HTH domain
MIDENLLDCHSKRLSDELPNVLVNPVSRDAHRDLVVAAIRAISDLGLGNAFFDQLCLDFMWFHGLKFLSAFNEQVHCYRDSKAMPYQSQPKSKPMPNAGKVFARILETLHVENGAQAAQKLGLSKPSVNAWKQNLPGLDNLIKIAELGNTSLDWLINGEEKRLPSEIAAALDDRIRKILREELGYQKEESGNLKLEIRKMVDSANSSGGVPTIVIGTEPKKKKTA